MKKPAPQEIYQHFKGQRYQILTLAKHSETGEELVVYQALYEDYQVYARPLDSFMSEVDREKYPEAGQKLRFERIGGRTEDGKTFFMGKPPADTRPAEEKASDQNDQKKQLFVPSAVMNRTIEEEAETLGLDPLVVAFLDADGCAERLQILEKLRPKLTNEMIDVLSMAVETEIPGTDVFERYILLRESLNMRERFESTRLRA